MCLFKFAIFLLQPGYPAETWILVVMVYDNHMATYYVKVDGVWVGPSNPTRYVGKELQVNITYVLITLMCLAQKIIYKYT